MAADGSSCSYSCWQPEGEWKKWKTAAQTAAVVHAAGEPYNEHAPPTFWYFNNWQGNGWRWFLKYGIVEAWGAANWLPGGANEDPELRQFQEARDVVEFKERAKELAKTNIPNAEYKTKIDQVANVFCKMKRGDIVVMTSNGKYGQDKGE